MSLLMSHKIRSTFYTESTLHKLLCTRKDQVSTDDKNNIVITLNVVTAKQSISVNQNGL